MPDHIEKLPKSYGIAVSLCGVFGVLGIHHFYLEDYLHGFADLGLFVLAMVFFRAR
jgi:TM2 domain-containing membrane protein YozV